MIGKWRRFYPFLKMAKNLILVIICPISIISSVAKVFGRLVYNQFYSYLNNNNLLSHHQSGFKASYSTVTS